MEKPTFTTHLGLIITTGEVQAQKQTDHAKAVARGPTPGAGAPRCGRTPAATSQAWLAQAVRRRFPKGGFASFHTYLHWNHSS